MYQGFYGLRDLPFELTPNPKYLFLTPRHREALSNLEYGLSSAKAITVLVGEAGTGKTTLIRAAIESDRCRRVDGVHLHRRSWCRASPRRSATCSRRSRPRDDFRSSARGDWRMLT